MALEHSPKIVTNGLVLALDAADRNSYVSGSTTWFDLAGSNNGTLINGPTFNSGNLGSIVFDGTNDYAEVTQRNIALEFQPTQPYSVFTWFKGPSAQQSAIVANLQNTPDYPGWDLFFNNSSTSNTIAMHLISTWSSNAIKIRVDYNYTTYLNQWIYFGYTYDGSCPTTSGASLTSVNFYFNGSLYTTGKALDNSTDGFNTSSETITYNPNQRFRVASRWQSGSAGAPASVTLPSIQIYNRALSATEVQQNFNALRGRFGI